MGFIDVAGLKDPTNIRIGDMFLLSDFMGCDSVYRKGYANKATELDDKQFREIDNLAETLEHFIAEHGLLGISYGYISPELSRKIVKYQNPDKPSYHRWDHGAAADVIFHDRAEDSPISIVRDLDADYFYSRVITYSESPYICVGYRCAENSRLGQAVQKEYRCALYENRYMGVGIKPKHVKYPMGASPQAGGKRRSRLSNVDLEHDWKGAGYPTYHGGGRMQYHHMRVSKYTMVSDFLYQKRLVHEGVENNIPSSKGDKAHWMRIARQAGEVYDHICNRLQERPNLGEPYRRVPITEAYNKHVEATNWSTHFTLEVANLYTDDATDYLLSMIRGHSLVRKAEVVPGDVPKIRIYGRRL